MTHAVAPSPTFTLWAGLLMPEVILKALSQGMPDAVPACSGGDIFSLMGLGIHPETGLPWLEATNEAIGFGAFAGNDGEDGIMHLSEPGCRNNPVEVVETKGPWLIENYGMRRDSGGPGRIPRRSRRDAHLSLQNMTRRRWPSSRRRRRRPGACTAATTATRVPSPSGPAPGASGSTARCTKKT